MDIYTEHITINPSEAARSLIISICHAESSLPIDIPNNNIISALLQAMDLCPIRGGDGGA